MLALSAVGLGGLFATDSASAASGDHLGEKWSGSPGSDTSGLGISKNDIGAAFFGQAGNQTDDVTDIGIRGESYSEQGSGVYGRARATTGSPKGLVGRADAPDGIGLEGQLRATNGGSGVALYGFNEAPAGTAIRGKASGSGNTYGVKGEVNSSDGYGIYTPDDAKVDGNIEVLGDLQVSGIKNFVQTVSSDAGPKQVKYTSVEAGEPQTEHSDVVEMEDGVAVVELPDHFGMVTSDDERLAVQVTPYCDELVQPQITDRSTNRIVVKDFGDGPDKYTFAYTVKGVRQGFENEEVVSDPS